MTDTDDLRQEIRVWEQENRRQERLIAETSTKRAALEAQVEWLTGERDTARAEATQLRTRLDSLYADAADKLADATTEGENVFFRSNEATLRKAYRDIRARFRAIDELVEPLAIKLFYATLGPKTDDNNWENEPGRHQVHYRREARLALAAILEKESHDAL
jgi:chromosome segregation ATPase